MDSFVPGASMVKCFLWCCFFCNWLADVFFQPWGFGVTGKPRWYFFVKIYPITFGVKQPLWSSFVKRPQTLGCELLKLPPSKRDVQSTQMTWRLKVWDGLGVLIFFSFGWGASQKIVEMQKKHFLQVGEKAWNCRVKSAGVYHSSWLDLKHLQAMKLVSPNNDKVNTTLSLWKLWSFVTNIPAPFPTKLVDAGVWKPNRCTHPGIQLSRKLPVTTNILTSPVPEPPPRNFRKPERFYSTP